MPYYRLYYLDTDDHIVGVDELFVDSDALACEAAHERVREGTIEVWQETRRVACILSAHDDPGSA